MKQNETSLKTFVTVGLLVVASTVSLLVLSLTTLRVKADEDNGNLGSCCTQIRPLNGAVLKLHHGMEQATLTNCDWYTINNGTFIDLWPNGSWLSPNSATGCSNGSTNSAAGFELRRSRAYGEGNTNQICDDPYWITLPGRYLPAETLSGNYRIARTNCWDNDIVVTNYFGLCGVDE